MKCAAWLWLSLITFLSYGQQPNKDLPLPDICVFNCVYKLNYQPDSTDKNIRTEYFKLLIGKKLSKFESAGSYLTDSLLTAEKSIPFTQENAQIFADKFVKLPQTRFHYMIYKKQVDGQLYCFDKIGDNLYRYEEPSNLIHWEIKPDKSTISGYSCQRATTTFGGRVYEAWFTREVPVAEGPYKFYGLPGLITKLSDSHNYYSFELVKLNKATANSIIQLPSKAAILTNKQKLWQGQHNYNMSLADRVAAIKGNATEAEKKSIRDRMKKRNNPLELK